MISGSFVSGERRGQRRAGAELQHQRQRSRRAWCWNWGISRRAGIPLLRDARELQKTGSFSLYLEGLGTVGSGPGVVTKQFWVVFEQQAIFTLSVVSGETELDSYWWACCDACATRKRVRARPIAAAAFRNQYHRWVQHGNVLLSQRGQPKTVYFDISRAAPRPGGGPAPLDDYSPLKRSPQRGGSPKCPEVVRHRRGRGWWRCGSSAVGHR